MTADRQVIESWLEKGQQQGATHVIIGRDMFDNWNYPIYVTIDQDVHGVEREVCGRDMQTVEEVYWLEGDIQTQLNLAYSHTYGPGEPSPSA